MAQQPVEEPGFSDELFLNRSGGQTCEQRDRLGTPAGKSAQNACGNGTRAAQTERNEREKASASSRGAPKPNRCRMSSGKLPSATWISGRLRMIACARRIRPFSYQCSTGRLTNPLRRRII